MGSSELFFSRMTLSQKGFHVARSASRVRRGDPRNWLFFHFGERAARPTGCGRERGSRLAVSARFLVVRAERRQHGLCEAVAKMARRSKKTRFYLVIWGYGYAPERKDETSRKKKNGRERITHEIIYTCTPMCLLATPFYAHAGKKNVCTPKAGRPKKKY